MSEEPVSFAAMATALRLGSDTSEQQLIEGYIAAAREWVEDYTGMLVVQREVTDRFQAFGSPLSLLKRPVESVVAVDFTSTGGEPLSYIDFEERLDGLVPHLLPSLSGWPPDVRAGSIRVKYLAGFALIDVPQRLVQAIMLLAAEFYRNRSAGAMSSEAERALEWQLRSFRVPML